MIPESQLSYVIILQNVCPISSVYDMPGSDNLLCSIWQCTFLVGLKLPCKGVHIPCPGNDWSHTRSRTAYNINDSDPRLEAELLTTSRCKRKNWNKLGPKNGSTEWIIQAHDV